MVKHRDWHTPFALPGDAPIGASFCHCCNAIFATSGDPLSILDSIQRGKAKALHRCKPLQIISVIVGVIAYRYEI